MGTIVINANVDCDVDKDDNAKVSSIGSKSQKINQSIN